MARTRPPSFDFYPDDFIAGTVGMHPLSRGIYISLLCHQWSHGSIPNPTNNRQFVQITGAMPDELEKHLLEVLSKFEQQEDGSYINVRLQNEYERKLSIREKRVNSGKKGGKSSSKQVLSNCSSKREAKQEVGSRKKEVSKKEKEWDPRTVDLPFPDHKFVEAWSDFVEMRNEIKKPMTPKACKASLENLKDMGLKRAVAALRHTTANNWQGIREPDQPRAGSGSAKQTTFAEQRVNNTVRNIEELVNE